MAVLSQFHYNNANSPDRLYLHLPSQSLIYDSSLSAPIAGDGVDTLEKRASLPWDNTATRLSFGTFCFLKNEEANTIMQIKSVSSLVYNAGGFNTVNDATLHISPMSGIDQYNQIGYFSIEATNLNLIPTESSPYPGLCRKWDFDYPLELYFGWTLWIKATLSQRGHVMGRVVPA